jgi:hypothetical protein
MNYEEFMKMKNFRMIEGNEIVVDIDDPGEKGLYCYNQTGINLVNAGYNIEIWFAKGMKAPHIHLRNIPHIKDLNEEELKKYKRLILERYVPREYWDEKIPDYSLCSKHPIAEENKTHHKYGTVKKLISQFNQDKQNFCEKDLYLQSKKLTRINIVRNLGNNNDTLAGKIAAKISIIGLADRYGIKPFGRLMRVCPFHADRNPSLSLNDQLGLFHCFGCNVSGNIIKFNAMLRKLEGGIVKNE